MTVYPYYPLHYFPEPDDTPAVGLYDWPTPDPVGPLVYPLTKLAELAAASPVFRARCGLAADDEDANAKLIDGEKGFQRRIFFPDVDWEEHRVFPSLVLQCGPEWQAPMIAGGGINYTKPEGNLRLVILDRDRYKGDVEKSLRDFCTFVGQLLDDLRSQFAYGTALAGTAIRLEHEPMRCSLPVETSLGYGYWDCSFLIDWSS